MHFSLFFKSIVCKVNLLPSEFLLNVFCEDSHSSFLKAINKCLPANWLHPFVSTTPLLQNIKVDVQGDIVVLVSDAVHHSTRAVLQKEDSKRLVPRANLLRDVDIPPSRYRKGEQLRHFRNIIWMEGITS